MTAFSITVDDAQVIAALQRLRSRTDNLGPALKTIGEDLVESTKRRFGSATAPDGTPWAANSETTIARYLGLTKGNFKKDGSLSKKGSTRLGAKKPLTGESGELAKQIDYQVNGNTLEVGSTMEYAGVQQFGQKQGASGRDKRNHPLPWGDIPARPFLGVSAQDIVSIEQSITDYLGLG